MPIEVMPPAIMILKFKPPLMLKRSKTRFALFQKIKQTNKEKQSQKIFYEAIWINSHNSLEEAITEFALFQKIKQTNKEMQSEKNGNNESSKESKSFKKQKSKQR
jgi:hypothetical protein